MNPALRATFDWLQGQGLPPLPVAPAQDPTRYPARNRDGSLKRDKDGALVPAFTGKNPSYVDSRGIPHLIRHTQYQNRMPTQAELQTWFAHPDNGIGTLGGWHNIVWVDVDVKQFESQQACDQRIADWLSQHPLLQQTFTERTHSGGWRLAVRVHEKTFTNFSLDGVGGHHMGEALGQGRFTVLAPTVGPSGKAYVNVQQVPPVWVERLDAIGLYPISPRREQTSPTCSSLPPRQSLPAQSGVLRLEDLVTAKAQAVLHGDSPLESRSHSLTFALREFYGWENWAAQNHVPMSGNAEELARAAGMALGIDDDRIERIIRSIPDPNNCIPAIVFAGGEADAWKRIWKLERRAYETCCPERIQRIIQTSVQRNCTSVRIKVAQDLDTVKHQRLLQELVRDAWYILRQTHALSAKSGGESSSNTLTTKKCSVQGRNYRLEAEGDQLTIQAGIRGIILQAHGEELDRSSVTDADIHHFRTVAKYIQKHHRVITGLEIRPLMTCQSGRVQLEI
jgi:hypothetical protein